MAVHQSGDPCPKCKGTNTRFEPAKPSYSSTHATGGTPKTTVRTYPAKLVCEDVGCAHIEEFPDEG